MCFPVNIQAFKNKFFYGAILVAASKWGNGKSQKEQT